MLKFRVRVRVRVSVRVKIKVMISGAFYPITGPQVRSPHLTRGLSVSVTRLFTVFREIGNGVRDVLSRTPLPSVKSSMTLNV